MSPEGILWTQGPHPVSLMLAGWGRPSALTIHSRLEDRYAKLDFSYMAGNVVIVLSWATQDKVRRFVIETGGENPRFLLFDDATTPQSGDDPLLRLCKDFLDKVSQPAPWHDERAVAVVEVLEWAERTLRAGR